MAKVTKTVGEPVTPPPVVIHLELTELEYAALREGAYHLHSADPNKVATAGARFTTQEMKRAGQSLYDNLPQLAYLLEGE